MTPLSLRVILLGGAAAVVLALAAGLYWKGRHDDAVVQKPKIEAATDKAVTNGLEAAGERASAARVDLVVTQREAAQAVASRVAQEAANAPDARSPLDPARALRLRGADERLCGLDPAICTRH